MDASSSVRVFLSTICMRSRMDQRAQSQPSAKVAIRSLFDAVIHKAESEPKGCLVVNTAVELSQHDTEAADKVQDSLLDTEKLLYKLLQQGRESGEIVSEMDNTVMSEYLNNALVGLRVMVKTARDTAKLERIVDATLSVLD